LPPPPPKAQPAPELNLGGTDSPSNAIVADTPNVIPAGPDAAYHNIDPVYPPEAARRGQQGTVELLIQVGPDGTARAVDVTSSSGFGTLDRAARDAVLAWHFRPGLRDGKPVASQFPLQIRFRIDQ
jgi:protein TonB